MKVPVKRWEDREEIIEINLPYYYFFAFRGGSENFTLTWGKIEQNQWSIITRMIEPRETQFFITFKTFENFPEGDRCTPSFKPEDEITESEYKKAEKDVLDFLEKMGVTDASKKN